MIRAIVILVLLIPITAMGQPVSPGEVLSAYLEAARAGDWEAAASYWLPEDIARSTRLGITYRDIPFKLDCSSFLMVPGVGEDPEPTFRDPVGALEAGPVRIRVDFHSPQGAHPSEYVLVRQKGRWLLAAMATALGRDWPATESRYLRFRVQPGRILNPAAILYLDTFVEECAARLGLSSGQMSRLADAKIDYLLCEDDVVEAIAGAPTRGVAMLPTDVVVTSEPAHTHELAHILVGYAAEDIGLYVLPVLQEGIAVHLGGRWGKSAAVQEELGRFILTNDLVDIEALLSWGGFRQMLPDMSYAPAGILAGYLLENLGPEGFLDLYRNQSGWSGELAGQDTDAVQADIVPRLGIAKGTLGEQVRARAQQGPGGGIEPGAGEVEGESIELVNEGWAATITVGEAWVSFDIISETGEPEGALLLGPAGGPEPAGRLFTERFPGRDYRGEKGAVLFNGREVGYYDFATEILMGKYVSDFRPDPSFLTGQGKRLQFQVLRSLLPPDATSWLIE